MTDEMFDKTFRGGTFCVVYVDVKGLVASGITSRLQINLLQNNADPTVTLNFCLLSF